MNVEFAIANEPVLAQARNISAGGMLINSTTPLAPQTELEFAIALPDVPRQPVCVRGRVVRVSARGTHVHFNLGQIQAALRIRRYAANRVIPYLTQEVHRPGVVARRVAELAELLIDFGRTDDAMTLFRAKLDMCRRDRIFCENMAVFWMEQLNLASSDAKRKSLSEELRIVCERGEVHADSVVVRAARDRVAAPSLSSSLTEEALLPSTDGGAASPTAVLEERIQRLQADLADAQRALERQRLRGQKP